MFRAVCIIEMKSYVFAQLFGIRLPSVMHCAHPLSVSVMFDAEKGVYFISIETVESTKGGKKTPKEQ